MHWDCPGLVIITKMLFVKMIFVMKMTVAMMTNVIQVKVFTAPDFMKLSVQQFLGKSEASINSTLLHTLEGHFRCFNS